jgi:hypothetical protein
MSIFVMEESPVKKSGYATMHNVLRLPEYVLFLGRPIEQKRRSVSSGANQTSGDE